ncbi:MAG: zf-HC2 domain-containing protein [Bacillota bacterium]
MSEPEKMPAICSETREMFSSLLDGEPAGEDGARLTEHILVCDPCRQEFELWKRISEALRNETVSEEPSPGFCAGVMSRLNREAGPGRGLLHTWRVPAAAAAAAAMLFAGSWGVTVALKPDKPPAAVVIHEEQAGENTPGGQDSGTKPEKAVQPDGAGRSDTAGVPADRPKADQPKNNNDGAGQPVSTEAVQPVEQFRLLENSHGDIPSTILKLSVTNTGDAQNYALALAANTGGGGQVLDTQKKGAGDLVIMRLTVPRDRGKGLVSQLSGLGGVISRVDERKSITDDYNQAVSRLNEIRARVASGVAPDEEKRLEAEASVLKRNIEQWGKESKEYVVILWLEH